MGNVLFDLKTHGIPTYNALYSLIATNYSDVFSYTDGGGVFHQSFLHCIVTGNHPILHMQREPPPHYCSVDNSQQSNIVAYNETFSPITSLQFSAVFGHVDLLNDCQLVKLQKMIQQARTGNRRLRFWGAPETAAFWDQLVEADGQRDVIVLNSDYLKDVHDYLINRGYNSTNQGCENTPSWCS